MKFCDKCDSKLIETKIGYKCPKCDKQEITDHKSQKETLVFNDVDFPFNKEEYYPQKIVRDKLGLHPQYGINYNYSEKFLVLFMSAYDLEFKKSHPYVDRFDSKTGLYHYTGQGQYGDQTLDGNNKFLADSNEKKTAIHFFEQKNLGSNHKYAGLVKLEKVYPEDQPDKSGKNRKVYVFLLRPIE